MIETYLMERETLKGVVMIMDIRRTPGTEEQNLSDWLSHYQIPLLRILTKTDKLSKTKQSKQLNAITEALCVDHKHLILFSAKSGRGKDSVWEAIEQLMK